MKTILIPIINGFFVRNFLRTDAFAIMKKNPDARLVLLAPQEKLDYYKKEFRATNVVFDIWPEVKNLRSEQLFRFLEMASIHSRTVKMMFMSDVKRKNSSDPMLFRWWLFFWKYFFWHLGMLRMWRVMVRKLYFFLPSHQFQNVLNKYRPDLVFCPAMVYGETLLMKEAQKKGIRTIGMVLSWDNLYSKVFIRVHPSHLLVHTDMIQQQAQQCADYPRENISVIGISQYDTHFRRDRVMPRDKFFRTIGADPSKKLILYAFSGKAALHIEFDIVEMLHQAIMQRKIVEPVDVLIRPYPRYDFPQEKLDILHNRYGFFAQSSVAHVGSRKDNWEFDEDALFFLANSIAHADLVITMYSTFFVEAAVYDKPLIGISFDGNQHLDYWNSAKRFFDWNHLADIKPLEGIDLVESREELVSAINRALENPDYLREGRARIVEQQCGFRDGKSAERLANTILRFL